MTWAGLDRKQLFGPYFSDNPVNQHIQLDMLQNWFAPQLKNLGIEANVWFQQDGGTACYAITIGEYLGEFSGNVGL